MSIVFLSALIGVLGIYQIKSVERSYTKNLDGYMGDAVHAVKKIIHEITSGVLQEMVKGNLNCRIEASFKGDFEHNKRGVRQNYSRNPLYMYCPIS